MSHIQVAGAGTQDPVPQLQRAQRMRPRNGGYHRVGYGRLGFPLASRHVVPRREYVCHLEMLYVTQHSWTWKRWGGWGGRGGHWGPRRALPDLDGFGSLSGRRGRWALETPFSRPAAGLLGAALGYWAAVSPQRGSRR